MTAYSDLDSAVSAFQGGAFEYLPKPFDVTKAVELIRRAVEESLREEVADSAAGADARDAGPGAGDAGRVPRHRPPEPEQRHGADHRRERHRQGTGGARAAQAQPARRRAPFVAINTAAIPKDLLESELFGHERGAFTGAQTMRRGRFEQADGGTLFLDEIGDMPFDLQTRLLRVLSDGQFYRVGGHQPLKSNVRVIAATHQNLEERVRQGALPRRPVPPPQRHPAAPAGAARAARGHPDADALLPAARAPRNSASRPSASPTSALARLAAFDFPGNVRQLENLCHWLTVMAPAQVVEAKDLPPELLASRRPAAAAGGRRRPHAAAGRTAPPPQPATARRRRPPAGAARRPGWPTWSARRAAGSTPASPRSGTR